eukprot:338917_1
MERVREYDEREELEDILCDKILNELIKDELIKDELIHKDGDGSTIIGQGRASGKIISQCFDELPGGDELREAAFIEDEEYLERQNLIKIATDELTQSLIGELTQSLIKITTGEPTQQQPTFIKLYGLTQRISIETGGEPTKESNDEENATALAGERENKMVVILLVYDEIFDELIRDKLIQAEGIDDEFIFELLNVSFIILFGGLNNCSGSSHGRNIYNEPTIEILLIIVLKVTLPPINEQKSDGIFILLTENYIKFEYMVIDIIILLIEVLIWIEVKIPSKYYGLIDEEDAVSQNGSERQNLVRRKLIVCVMEFIKIKVMLFITLVIILFKIFTTATCTSERSNLFDELVDDELIDEEESDGKGVVGLGEEEAVFGEEIMTLFDELVYDELIDNNNDEVIILLNGYLINPTLITTSEENKLGDDLLGILFGGIACAILLLTIILNENNNIGRDKYKESTIVRTHWA